MGLVSLFFEHPKQYFSGARRHLLTMNRHRFFFVFWLRCAKYNDVCQLFLYFAMIGQVVMVRMSLNLIPENVVESEQSNDRQESLNCHCEGLLICFLKEISQK